MFVSIVNRNSCVYSRLLIWSEGAKDSGIYKSQLNGNMIKTIIRGSVARPVRLTWDGVSQKLFWIDSELGTIESVDLNGLNRKVQIFFLHLPFSALKWNTQVWK